MDLHADILKRWEPVFEPGLVAKSYANCPEPRVRGHVHVVRGLPEQSEPSQTGLAGPRIATASSAPAR